MNTRYMLVLATATATALIVGAAAHQLWAQTKPPAYAVTEVLEVTQEDGYREFLPLVAKALQDHGARYLARGGRNVSVSGASAERGSIIAFDNFDQAQAAFNSSAYREARAIGDKYAKIRVYIREGLP